MSLRFSVSAALLVGATVLGVSLVTGEEPAKTATKPAAPLELFKKLSGDWTGKASHGGDLMDAKVNYRVTSAGSAVIETLFGGTEHEMITMYHLSGDDLLLTHYCALANQPRMKAVKSNNPKKIEFRFLDGTNIDAAKDLHMHEMTIEFVDDDHIKSEWTTFAKGKPMDTAKFDMQRVKKK